MRQNGERGDLNDGRSSKKLCSVRNQSLTDGCEDIQNGCDPFRRHTEFISDILGNRSCDHDGHCVVGGAEVHQQHQDTDTKFCSTFAFYRFLYHIDDQ